MLNIAINGEPRQTHAGLADQRLCRFRNNGIERRNLQARSWTWMETASIRFWFPLWRRPPQLGQPESRDL